jgi:hypothetical protein
MYFLARLLKIILYRLKNNKSSLVSSFFLQKASQGEILGRFFFTFHQN